MKMLFYTSTTHELRTPLNGIIGVLQMMEPFVTQNRAKELLNIATNSAHHLESLIEDVIDLSRIENGHF